LHFTPTEAGLHHIESPTGVGKESVPTTSIPVQVSASSPVPLTLDFTPKMSGKHTAEVIVDGVPVAVHVDVPDKPKVKATQKHHKGKAGQDTVLPVALSGANPKALKVDLKDAKGNIVGPADIIQTEPDKDPEIHYTAPSEGKFQIAVTGLDDTPVEGSPIPVEVEPSDVKLPNNVSPKVNLPVPGGFCELPLEISPSIDPSSLDVVVRDDR
jgi:hypothetical protein